MPVAAVVLAVHTVVLVLMALYFRRRYIKAVRRINRHTETLVHQNRFDELQAEIEYLRKRNAVLIRGLFPRGDIPPGEFNELMDQDPELRALAEMLDFMHHQPRKALTPVQPSTVNPSA